MARDWSNQVTRRKPPEGPKPETANIPADMKRKLDHVAEISKNARATWFSLILLLLFSTIAVAGVQDRDYFTYGAGLTLPVINFQVPVTSFFAVTPVLILGLYTYLHLYLLKLWRALGDLPGQLPNGVALDDAVFPWMVADAAILLKPGAQGRAFGWLTRSVSFIFLWAAGPIVLSAFWWRSFPPHNLLLTSWIGLLLCVSILGGSLSFLLRWRRLKNGEGRSATLFYPFLLIASVCASVVMLATVLTAGLSRIVWMIDVPVPAWASEEAEDAYQADEPIYAPGRRSWLYSANLYRAELVERPKTWLPRAEALEEFKARFNKTARSEFSKDQDWRAAIEAFETQRGALLESLRAEDFKGRNFQGANLEEAFLPGLDLAGANLHGAILDSAQLEAVDLTSADLQWARLKGADLQGADLQGADLQWAILIGADLQGADLQGADLQEAHLEWANLQWADLRAVDLQWAHLQGVDLQGANLKKVDLTSVNLSLTRNLTQDQINSAFGDGGTILPDGLVRPENWPEEVLEPEEAVRQWTEWFMMEWSKAVAQPSDVHDEARSAN